jgi:hypothetical protein
VSIELGLASAALLVSAWSAWTGWKNSRDQNTMQAQLLRLETARERDRVSDATRATLVARMQRFERSARLIVLNGGRSAAQVVRVRVDGKPINENPWFRDVEQPISLIGPDAPFEVMMMTVDGMPTKYRVELDWEDASGQPGHWASDLTLVR